MTSNSLITSSQTKSQALKRLGVLKDFIEFWQFKPHPQTEFKDLIVAFESTVKINITSETLWLKSLDQTFFDLFKPTSSEKVLQLMAQEIDQAKLVIIYLPFETTPDTITQLSQWMKTNLGPETLMDIIFDGSLIGGCAISYNGVYLDYSLKHKIFESKTKVLEILRGYKQKTIF